MVCAICGRMPLITHSAPINLAADTVLSGCCATNVSTVGTPVMSIMAMPAPVSTIFSSRLSITTCVRALSSVPIRGSARTPSHSTTTGVEACLFYDPDGGERPTIQLYCVPIVYLDRDLTSAEPTFGMTLTSCLLRPKARGTVRLRSANPDDKPVVDSNFFGHPDDLRLSIASLRHAREIVAAEPLKSKLRAELLPGPEIVDDEALTKFSGQTVKTNYHPSGTLRMGRDDDPLAVVDARLRVRGVEGLRVIDCSIIPAIPSGNTNAPAMAIGSKAASLIAADHGKAAS